MALINLKTTQFTSDNGKMVIDMAKENNIGSMGAYTKDIGKKVRIILIIKL